MRITGGVLCGRLVEVPPGKIRPAMDRMRESIFAHLGDLAALSFLDLFSGSGIMALEAASRGAEVIEAVEKDAGKKAVLLKNAAMSSVRINCRFMPVELYVERAGALLKEKGAFDVIFCDPPFPYKWKSELVNNIAKSAIMGSGSRLLLHYPKEEALSLEEGVKLEETRLYGRSKVDFFIRND